MEERENIILKISTLGLFCLIISLASTLPSQAALTKKRQLLFYFDKIEVKGAVDVYVQPGPRNEEAFIYADSDILDKISLRVREKTLFVEANNTFDCLLYTSDAADE